VVDEGNGTHNVERISQVDGLGRVTSVCEVTGATQSGPGGTPGACGQDINKTGFLTTYGYDALSNLLNVIQGSLGQRTFSYDSLSHLLCAANPETGGTTSCPNPDNGAFTAGTTRYSYDGDGNPISRVRPAPNQTSASTTITTAYTYDALNRLTQKSYSDGVTPPALFGYDQTSITMGSGSQPFTITNSIGRLSWTCMEYGGNSCPTMTATSYDPMGRVAELWQRNPVNSNNIWVSYKYDLLGDEIDRNLSSSDYPETYNVAGRLTSFGGAMLANGHYDPFGHLISATLGNGLMESWSYDKRGRPTAMAVGKTCSAGVCTGSTAYSYSIGYAPNGDVVSAKDSVNGTWTYSYDDFDRVATSNCSATCPDGASTQGLSYAYDRYDRNRWKQTVTAGSGPQPTFTFNGAGNVPTNRIDTYSYDAAGNLLKDAINTYQYDAENRIISVNNGAITYTYTADGQRAGKTVGSVTSDIIYDREGHVMLFNSSSLANTPFWQIYVAGMHLGGYVVNSTVTNGDFYYDHADWLGTERTHTNMTGVVCETAKGLPFGDGQVITAVNGGCTDAADVSPMHFTGKERDTESGLDYFGDRHYGSSIGRFMQPDEPFNDQETRDPQSWNLYSYVRNNPLNRIDPDGRDCVYLNNSGKGVESIDQSGSSGECGNTGGYWVNGAVTNAQIDENSVTLTGTTNGVDNNTHSSYLTNGDTPLNSLAQGVFSQPVIGYARGTVQNYIAPPLLGFLTVAVPGALEAGGPEITSLGLLKSAAQALPKLGGMTREAAKEALEKNGFKKQGVTKGGYEKWGHSDGSKVWIGPDGGIDKIPPGGGGYRVTPDGDIARPHTFPEEKLED